MKISLMRVAESDKGTFGVLVIDEIPICVTCEDPWNENHSNISCIPMGTYEVQKFNGTKYKDVWQIMNVPNRSAILIHNGNTIKDTEGCVLVGESFSLNGPVPMVTNSVKTLEKLRDILPDEFSLRIMDAL